MGHSVKTQLIIPMVFASWSLFFQACGWANSACKGGTVSGGYVSWNRDPATRYR